MFDRIKFPSFVKLLLKSNNNNAKKGDVFVHNPKAMRTTYPPMHANTLNDIFIDSIEDTIKRLKGKTFNDFIKP